jgi:ribosome-associated translation inhibitor RaiA
MKIEVSTKSQNFLMMQTANVRQRIKEKVNILKKYLDEIRKIPFNGMDIKVLKGQWYPYK